MTEFDRVGNSDNFNFSGFHHFCNSALREAPAGNAKKDGEMVLLLIYSKSLGVRSQVYPVNKNKVFMRIKL